MFPEYFNFTDNSTPQEVFKKSVIAFLNQQIDQPTLIKYGLQTAHTCLNAENSRFIGLYGNAKLAKTHTPLIDELSLRKQGLTVEALRARLREAIRKAIEPSIEKAFTVWKNEQQTSKQQLTPNPDQLNPNEKYELAVKAKDWLIKDLVINTVIELSSLIDAEPVSTENPQSPSWFVGQN